MSLSFYKNSLYRNKWIIGFAVFVIAIIVLKLLVTSDTEHLTYRVDLRDLRQEVNSVGVVDAKNAVTISSELEGETAKIIYIVPDGTIVKKGDILIQFSAGPLEKKVQEYQDKVTEVHSSVEATKYLVQWEAVQYDREKESAAYTLSSAELAYKKLVNGDGPFQTATLKAQKEEMLFELNMRLGYIKTLNELKEQGVDVFSELTQATEEHNKYQKLYDLAVKNLNSYTEHVYPSELEEAKSTVAKAEMALGQTKKSIQYKLAEGALKVKRVEDKLKTAINRLEEAKLNLAKATVRSKIDGIAVIAEGFIDGSLRKHRTGDTVWKNKPIIYLPDTSSFIVRTQVREIDLNKISIGSKATVLVEAYPDTLHEAEIFSVGTMVKQTKDNSHKTFGVDINIENIDKRLRPGMSAIVRMIGKEVKSSIVIPIESIFVDKRGNKYCYIKRLTGYKKRYITTALQNEFSVEVTSGLKVGDVISLIEPEN